jgi:hypothetical protein
MAKTGFNWVNQLHGFLETMYLIFFKKLDKKLKTF